MRETQGLLANDPVSTVEIALTGNKNRCVWIPLRNYTCRCNPVRPKGEIRLGSEEKLCSFWREFAITWYFALVVGGYQSKLANLE